MSITSAIVLYVTTWFMTLFCVLPYRTVSQDEAKEIVPGTPPGRACG
jgi:predicted secreted protein